MFGVHIADDKARCTTRACRACTPC